MPVSRRRQLQQHGWLDLDRTLGNRRCCQCTGSWSAIGRRETTVAEMLGRSDQLGDAHCIGAVDFRLSSSAAISPNARDASADAVPATIFLRHDQAPCLARPLPRGVLQAFHVA